MVDFRDMGGYCFENIEIKWGSLIQITITSELVVQSGKNKVSLTRGYSQELKFDITFMIWVNFGVMTF